MSYYRQDIQNKIAAQNPQPTRSYNRAEVQQKIAAKQQPQQAPITTQAPVQEYYYTREQAQANIAARTQSPEAAKSLPQGAKITAYDPLTQKITYRTAEQEAAYQSSTRFYTAIGYPQYGGEYAPINIPAGMKVESIKKTAFNTLEVTFTKTVESPLDTAIKRYEDYTFSESNPRIGGTTTSPLRDKLVVTSEGELSTVGREQITAFLTPSDKLAFKEYQVAQKNKRLTDLGVFLASGVTAPLSLAYAPVSLSLAGARTVLTQAALGGAVSLGVSQGIKGATGGGWLTPSEALEAGVAGAIMAPLGAKTVSILKITGKSLPSTLGRVGVNAVLGGAVSGGVEYVTTGKVSAENVLIGAGAGAVFGGVTEGLGRVNLRYDVTGKATSKVQDAVLKRQSTLKTLDAINTKYEYAYAANRLPSYSFREKLAMKITGVTPQKPTPQLIEVPTIPTANPASFETYMGERTVMRDIIAYDSKGVPVDRFSIKDSEFAPMIREKPSNVLSYRNMVEGHLKTKTNIATELIDAGSVIYGKSESPEIFFSKAQDKPQAFGMPKKLGFSKTQTQRRVDQLKLRKNTLKDLINNIDLFPEVSNVGMTTREATAIRTAQRNSKTINSEQVMKELNSKWLTDKVEAKSPTLNAQKNPLVQELIQGKAEEPTGVSKVLNDIAEGRVADTARYARQGYTPSVYGGLLYYKRQTRQEETEYQVISYPKGSPFSLPSMITDRTPTMNQRRGNNRLYPSALIPTVGAGGVLKLPTKDKTDIGLTRIAITPSILVNDFLKQDIYMVARATQDQAIEPISIPRETARNVQPIINITDEPITPITDRVARQDTFSDFFGAKSALDFWPGESKIAEGGGFGNSNLRARGIRSRKKRYPILSAAEFLNFDRRPKRRKK